MPFHLAVLGGGLLGRSRSSKGKVRLQVGKVKKQILDLKDVLVRVW